MYPLIGLQVQTYMKAEIASPLPLSRLVNWDAELTTIQNDSTRIGDAMIEKWKQSKP
jgi:hypothetical protein